MKGKARQAILFLKKKKQKNFMNLGHALDTSVTQINKTFLLLFYKKEVLALHPPTL
jgi:hypothetical protein